MLNKIVKFDDERNLNKKIPKLKTTHNIVKPTTTQLLYILKTTSIKCDVPDYPCL